MNIFKQEKRALLRKLGAQAFHSRKVADFEEGILEERSKEFFHRPPFLGGFISILKPRDSASKTNPAIAIDKIG